MTWSSRIEHPSGRSSVTIANPCESYGVLPEELYCCITVKVEVMGISQVLGYDMMLIGSSTCCSRPQLNTNMSRLIAFALWLSSLLHVS